VLVETDSSDFRMWRVSCVVIFQIGSSPVRL